MDDLTQLASAAQPSYQPRRQRSYGDPPGYLLIVISATVTLGVSLVSIVGGLCLIVYWSSDPALGKLAQVVGTDRGMALIGAGIGGMLVAAVALAVRDIARNSWRRL